MLNRGVQALYLTNILNPFNFSTINIYYATRFLNKKIRKATKNKQSFEKPERLLDYLFVVIKDFEAENWMKYPVSAYNYWTQLTQPI